MLLWWLLILVPVLVAIALLPAWTNRRGWRARPWGYYRTGISLLMVLLFALLLATLL